nr:hypothetical protein [Tanacetum cinerariifolium]
MYNLTDISDYTTATSPCERDVQAPSSLWEYADPEPLLKIFQVKVVAEDVHEVKDGKKKGRDLKQKALSSSVNT